MKVLRLLPAVHQLQEDDRFIELLKRFSVSQQILTTWLSDQIDIVRKKILDNKIASDGLDREDLTAFIFAHLEQKVDLVLQNNLRNVINATGVVLHTNLGRARLSKAAIRQITDTASSYSTLEYDIKTGNRGSRHSIVEDYLCELTGAEAAMVVNNNAAAVYLVLKAVAEGKEAIVSRGELVEIGGSFRISEIMEESDVSLVEVGTTNKTHVADYEKAITEETALFMKVHKSNFEVVGFTEEVDTVKLVELSRQHKIPIYEDLGSGTLFDFEKQRVGQEPTVQTKVSAGIDIISFSGDKLLGGPQAGVIVGQRQMIDQMKQHQLARVLRVDKFTLAALEATLKAYVRGEEQREVPTIRDMLESSESVLEKAKIFVDKVSTTKSKINYDISRDTSRVGGGTMPTVELDTYVVQVKHEQMTSEKIAEQLRNYVTPIIVRVKNDMVILDFRTVDRKELYVVIEAFVQIQQMVG